MRTTLTRERSLLLFASTAIALMLILLALTPSALVPLPLSDGPSDNSSSKAMAHTTEIVIPLGTGDNESLDFQPASITVVIGVNNTVIWNDLDAAQHTVTSLALPPGAAKFNSGILNQGQLFNVTLTVQGTYRYYCTIHPTWMRGTIIVRA